VNASYHNTVLDFKGAVVEYIALHLDDVLREGQPAVKRCLQVLRELAVDGATGTLTETDSVAAGKAVLRLIAAYKPVGRNASIVTGRNAMAALPPATDASSAVDLYAGIEAAIALVRCAFFDRKVHSRMPLVRTSVR
jgi:hypothetical protein